MYKARQYHILSCWIVRQTEGQKDSHKQGGGNQKNYCSLKTYYWPTVTYWVHAPSLLQVQKKACKLQLPSWWFLHCNESRPFDVDHHALLMRVNSLTTAAVVFTSVNTLLLHRAGKSCQGRHHYSEEGQMKQKTFQTKKINTQGE